MSLLVPCQLRESSCKIPKYIWPAWGENGLCKIPTRRPLWPASGISFRQHCDALTGPFSLPKNHHNRTLASCDHHKTLPYHQGRGHYHTKVKDLVVELQQEERHTFIYFNCLIFSWGVEARHTINYWVQCCRNNDSTPAKASVESYWPTCCHETPAIMAGHAVSFLAVK